MPQFKFSMFQKIVVFMFWVVLTSGAVVHFILSDSRVSSNQVARERSRRVPPKEYPSGGQRVIRAPSRRAEMGVVMGSRKQGKVDINTADYAQLMQLPSIGPVRAREILAYRDEHGLFDRVSQLRNVKRIGPRILAKIRHLLTVNGICEVEDKTVQADKPKRSMVYQRWKGDTIPQKHQKVTRVDKSQLDLSARCPFCRQPIYQKGMRKKRYIYCPHCLQPLSKRSNK